MHPAPKTTVPRSPGDPLHFIPIIIGLSLLLYLLLTLSPPPQARSQMDYRQTEMYPVISYPVTVP